MRGFSHFEMWPFSNKGSTSEGGVEEKAERTKKGPGPCCSLRRELINPAYHGISEPLQSLPRYLAWSWQSCLQRGKKHKYVGNLQGHMTQGESDAYIVRKASYVLWIKVAPSCWRPHDQTMAVPYLARPCHSLIDVAKELDRINNLACHRDLAQFLAWHCIKPCRLPRWSFLPFSLLISPKHLSSSPLSSSLPGSSESRLYEFRLVSFRLTA